MMDAGASNGRMSDKRNDQAVISPKACPELVEGLVLSWSKGEKFADPSNYPVVRCAGSSGFHRNLLKSEQIRKVLDKGDIECPAFLLHLRLCSSAAVNHPLSSSAPR